MRVVVFTSETQLTHPYVRNDVILSGNATCFSVEPQQAYARPYTHSLEIQSGWRMGRGTSLATRRLHCAMLCAVICKSFDYVCVCVCTCSCSRVRVPHILYLPLKPYVPCICIRSRRRFRIDALYLMMSLCNTIVAQHRTQTTTQHTIHIIRPAIEPTPRCSFIKVSSSSLSALTHFNLYSVLQLDGARLFGVADRLPPAAGRRIRAPALAVPARLHWHTKLYV